MTSIDHFDPPIKKPIVFVVGAGCSVPYGFPSGVDLVDQLTNAHYQAPELADYSDSQRARFLNSGQDYQRILRESRLYSIDEFLRAQRDNSAVQQWGRIEIARNILAAEARALQADQAGAWTAKSFVSQDWLRYLWNTLKAPPDVFRTHQIAFFTLNYDRLLEHYFTSAMQSTYDVSWEEARAAVSSIPIVHLHGTIGIYTKPDAGLSVEQGRLILPFGAQPSIPQLASALRDFQMGWERGGDVPGDSVSAKRLAEYELLLILGIGQAAPLLMPIIRPSGRAPVPSKVWATAYGLEGQERRSIYKLVGGRERVLPSKVDAALLLREHIAWHWYR